MGEFILFEKREHVAYVTINRPEVRNALSIPAMDELIETLRLCRDDDDVRVIVIGGAGDKAFCAGGDLAALRRQMDNGSMAVRNFTSAFAELTKMLVEVGKPTIAAVHGYALAGGFGLAVSCDLTIAADDSVFAVPEITVGFWGGIITAPVLRQIGMKNTMDLFYTGRQIKADEALRMGVCNRVVPFAELDAEVEKLARRIARNSPSTMRVGRESLYTCRDMEFLSSVNYLREIVTVLAQTNDTREGIDSFLEKRKPEYHGN